MKNKIMYILINILIITISILGYVIAIFYPECIIDLLLVMSKSGISYISVYYC